MSGERTQAVCDITLSLALSIYLSVAVYRTNKMVRLSLFIVTWLNTKRLRTGGVVIEGRL